MSAIDRPDWVAPDRPRWIRDWSADTTVWVTSWGDCVHLTAFCPGTKAYGSAGKPTRAKLREPICAARRGCGKCFGEFFGEFFGESSLRDLERLINRLHGAVDEDRPARAVIAAKARKRFGTDSKQAGGKATRASAKPAKSSKNAGPTGGQPSGSPSGRTPIISSGFGKPPGSRPKPTDGSVGAPQRAARKVGKAEAKARRDHETARRRGITVEQLKVERRAQNEKNRLANQRRREEGG